MSHRRNRKPAPLEIPAAKRIPTGDTQHGEVPSGKHRLVVGDSDILALEPDDEASETDIAIPPTQSSTGEYRLFLAGGLGRPSPVEPEGQSPEIGRAPEREVAAPAIDAAATEPSIVVSDAQGEPTGTSTMFGDLNGGRASSCVAAQLGAARVGSEFAKLVPLPQGQPRGVALGGGTLESAIRETAFRVVEDGRPCAAGAGSRGRDGLPGEPLEFSVSEEEPEPASVPDAGGAQEPEDAPEQMPDDEDPMLLGFVRARLEEFEEDVPADEADGLEEASPNDESWLQSRVSRIEEPEPGVLAEELDAAGLSGIGVEPSTASNQARTHSERFPVSVGGHPIFSPPRPASLKVELSEIEPPAAEEARVESASFDGPGLPQPTEEGRAEHEETPASSEVRDTSVVESSESSEEVSSDGEVSGGTDEPSETVEPSGSRAVDGDLGAPASAHGLIPAPLRPATNMFADFRASGGLQDPAEAPSIELAEPDETVGGQADPRVKAGSESRSSGAQLPAWMSALKARAESSAFMPFALIAAFAVVGGLVMTGEPDEVEISSRPLNPEMPVIPVDDVRELRPLDVVEMTARKEPEMELGDESIRVVSGRRTAAEGVLVEPPGAGRGVEGGRAGSLPAAVGPRKPRRHSLLQPGKRLEGVAPDPIDESDSRARFPLPVDERFRVRLTVGLTTSHSQTVLARPVKDVLFGGRVVLRKNSVLKGRVTGHDDERVFIEFKEVKVGRAWQRFAAFASEAGLPGIKAIRREASVEERVGAGAVRGAVAGLQPVVSAVAGGAGIVGRVASGVANETLPEAKRGADVPEGYVLEVGSGRVFTVVVKEEQ